MLVVCVIAGSVCNTGGKGNRGVGEKKGYRYSSPCDLVPILHSVR
jgi:hypothetical protein